MAKKVRMSDIAAELHVSTVTVSKALADQKGVSEELRAKIKERAMQLQYIQPQAVSNESCKKSYNIGVIAQSKFFGKYESFYWQIYQGLTTNVVQNDCFLMLELISTTDEIGLITPKLVKEKKVDGIILLGQPSNEYTKSLRAEFHGPLICLDFYEGSNGLAIISNGYYGTYMLTNHLFDMGHEEIAYVGTLLYTNSITDRYFGYCKSMLEHGKKIPEEWLIDDRDWETGDVNTFKMKLPDRMPTAFVCNSDFTANILIRLLRENNYRVPEDVSVVGFDNYLFPGLCDIGITSYDVDTKEMTGRCIRELIELMSTGVKKTGIIIIDGNIVLKDSVARRT